MDDDSYPPGNFAPEEPAFDELEAGEGEEGVYAAADVSSSSTARVSKRKREAPPPNATLTSEQIQAKLHHLNRSLLAQAKKAQSFELQRLRKHRKDAKRDVSKDAELDASIATLKGLALPALIASSLYIKLQKAHLFTHYPILTPLVPAPASPMAPASEEAKAGNRVLSNKAFAKEAAEALKRVKTWVDGDFKVQEKARARNEDDFAAEVQPVAPTRKGTATGRNTAAGMSSAGGLAGEDGSSENEDGPLPDMVSDEDVDGENSLGLNTDYFSGGSDSEDDDAASQASWSSGSVSSQPPAPAKKAKVGASSKASGEASTSTSPPPAKEIKKAAGGKEKVKSIPKKVTSSLFLPSLAAGYTFGGSDSEPEELSDDGKGERKNRRGQRARKAIWEKKYGANANHLKAQRAEGSIEGASGPPPVYTSNRGTRGGRGGFVQSTRGGPAGRGRGGATFVVPSGTDGGWGKPSNGSAATSALTSAPASASRGGFAGSRGVASAGRGGFGGSPSRGGFGSRPAAAAGPPREKKPEKEMHPSWVAKQKLKEKMSAGVKAAGKKITFD